MREEHPNQTELPGLPVGGPAPAPGSDQVREMSEVAQVQAKVIDMGLVRESRPVFVYDAKLAKQKSGNAARQAKHREGLEKKGLAMAQVPRDLVELVKTTHGGDWTKLTSLAPLGDTPKPQTSGIEVREVIKEVRVEVPVEVIKEVRIEVPGPTIYKEKIVEKPVVRLTSEQKKSLLLGEKVQKMTGWRAAIARKLLGI
jgi:hypothetical protein